MFFKKVMVIILILAVGATSFQKAIALLDYRINKNYIAANLCVNRSLPRSCCRGKCWLNKQLQKEESNNRDNKVPTAEKNQILLFIETTPLSFFPADGKVKYTQWSGEEQFSGFPVSIFHPPGLMS